MSFQPWPNPDPVADIGLNSAVIYGENVQVAVGLNHQLAVGSNYQLCLNPSVLIDFLNTPGADALNAFCGSGIGGNIQFTVGTNTNVVWGRQYTVNLGPDTIDLKGNQHSLFVKIMCAIIGGISLVFVIAYGADNDENRRATYIVLYQTLIDLALAVLMMGLLFLKNIDDAVVTTLKAAFLRNIWPASSTALQHFETMAAWTAVLGAAAAIPIVVGTHEGHFDGEQTQSASG